MASKTSSSDGVALDRLESESPVSALSASAGPPPSSTAVKPPILETGERTLELREIRRSCLVRLF